MTKRVVSRGPSDRGRIYAVEMKGRVYRTRIVICRALRKPLMRAMLDDTSLSSDPSLKTFALVSSSPFNIVSHILFSTSARESWSAVRLVSLVLQLRDQAGSRVLSGCLKPPCWTSCTRQGRVSMLKCTC